MKIILYNDLPPKTKQAMIKRFGMLVPNPENHQWYIEDVYLRSNPEVYLERIDCILGDELTDEIKEELKNVK